MITINFTGNINNDSLQVGDTAYYIAPSTLGGFEQSTSAPEEIGIITEVSRSIVQVPGFCDVDPVTNTTELLCNADNGTWTDPIFGGQITVDELATITMSTADNFGDFIMFAKDTSVNLSGLVGYYAEVKINNNSKEKAEMFSVASEITTSSK